VAAISILLISNQDGRILPGTRRPVFLAELPLVATNEKDGQRFAPVAVSTFST